jgi:hypothetical protein
VGRWGESGRERETGGFGGGKKCGGTGRAWQNLMEDRYLKIRKKAINIPGVSENPRDCQVVKVGVDVCCVEG